MPQTNPWEEDWSNPVAAANPQPGPQSVVIAPAPRVQPEVRSIGDTLVSIDPSSGGVTPIYTAPQGRDTKADAEAGVAATTREGTLRALRLQIDRVRDLYELNFRGGAPNALVNLLPNFAYPALGEFESAGSGLAETGNAAFRVPGSGPATDADAARFVAANTPQPGDSDAVIEQKLMNLETRLNEQVRAMGRDPAAWATQVRQTAQQPAQQGQQRNQETPGAFIPRTAGVGADPSAPTGGAAPVGSGPTVQRPPALRGLHQEIRQLLASGAPLEQIQQHYSQRLADAGFPNANLTAPLGNIAYAYRELQANPRKNLNEILSGWDALDTVVSPPENTSLLENPLGALQYGLGVAADNPFGAAAISAGNGASGGLLRYFGDNATILDAQRAEHPVASAVGDLVGTTAGVASVGKLGTLARGGALLTRAGGIGGDVLYGSFRGFNEAPEGQGLTGAAIGGIAGLAGNALGQGVSPVGTALLDTRLGNTAANAYLAAQNRIANGARALAGRNPQPRRMFAAPPRPTGGEQMLAGAITDPTDIIAQLDNARANNVPLALADTTDSLRGLAGAAYRRATPEVRDPIAANIRGRALDQADRGQGYVNNIFGPTGNPNEIADSLTQQARTAARPLYEAAYARPAPVDPTIDEFLSRPVGQQALQNARTIAMNEGRDPNALGFGMNDLGEITYNQAPSYETLDYIKRGIDGIIEPRRDPITRQLPTNDPAFSAIENFRKSFVRRLDELNPDYAAARQAYAGPVRMREAMQDGRGAFGMQPRDIQVQMGRMGQPEADMYRLGARVQMGDILGNQRDTVNPFSRLTGSPTSRERLSTVFSPEQAQQFDQIANMEGNIGRTTTELLGGSQTASRQMADQQFGDGILGNTVIGAAETMATGAPLTTLMRQGAFQMLRDRRALGLGAQRRADELLPILTLDDPAQVTAATREILANVNARRSYVQRNRRRGGMFGTAGTISLTAPVIAGQ